MRDKCCANDSRLGGRLRQSRLFCVIKPVPRSINCDPPFFSSKMRLMRLGDCKIRMRARVWPKPSHANGGTIY